MTSLGIVGGGQLGQMLTQAASELDITVTCIDPGVNPPAVQVGANQIRGALDDKLSLRKLVEVCDYVTWEIEHIDANELSAASNSVGAASIQPNPDSLIVIKDKLSQKDHVARLGVPTVPYQNFTGEAQALEFVGAHGGAVLKTRTGGFDGRGNYVIEQPDQLPEGLAELSDAPLYLEALCRIDAEISVIVARNVTAGSGSNVVTYDPVDMVNQDNICHVVVAPSQQSDLVKEAAKRMASAVVSSFGGSGVFAVEMFVVGEEVLFNEVAPRVHNSGHHTIEACETSQFSNHVRAVCGMELGDSSMKVDQAVMVNVLGSNDSPGGSLNAQEVAEIAHLGGALHWYGKTPTKKARKMGHITMTGGFDEPIEQLIERAVAAREVLSV